jgi:hypothetical protein
LKILTGSIEIYLRVSEFARKKERKKNQKPNPKSRQAKARRSKKTRSHRMKEFHTIIIPGQISSIANNKIFCRAIK